MTKNKITIYVGDDDIVEIITPAHTFEASFDLDTNENWKMVKII